MALGIPLPAGMRRPFEFSAWDEFQKQPLTHPGRIFDRADNDGISAVPEGGPAPYGRVLVVGISGHQGTQAGGPARWGLPDRYHTFCDSVSLPDKDGMHLKTPDGQTYDAAGLSLPVDEAGLLIVRGIGMWTEAGSCFNSRLDQPFGLGDLYYQPEMTGQIGMAQEGRIWCYCETDIDVGDKLFFRTVVTSTTDGIQLLGAFSNVGGAGFQEFVGGSVFRPGPAGGAFVINLNK
jgi:hypothetical protein